MTNAILHKYSATASAVPAAASISPRELAINTADGRLFTKTDSGTIVELARKDLVPSGSGTSTGTNTGDNAVNSLYSGLVTNASHTGDVTGATALTLAAIITAGGPTGSASVVPVITYDAKGRLTAVTTATITPAAIGAQAYNSNLTAINQALTTTSSPTFGGVNLSTTTKQDAVVLTTTATTQVNLDTFVAATYRSAQYVVQVYDTITGAVHFTTISVVHDSANNVYLSEYGTLFSNAALATFTANFSTPNIQLLVTPLSANSTQFKVLRTLIGA